jgi:hypothetical protein
MLAKVDTFAKAVKFAKKKKRLPERQTVWVWIG